MKWQKLQIALLNNLILRPAACLILLNSPAFADSRLDTLALENIEPLANVLGVISHESEDLEKLASENDSELSQGSSNGKASDLLGADGKPLSKSNESERKLDCDKIKRQMTAVMSSKIMLLKFCESQNLKMKELGLRYCPKDSCFVSLASPARDPIEIFFNAWSSDYLGSPGLMVGVKFSLDRSLASSLSCLNIGKETFTLDELDAYLAYVELLESKLECEQS